MSRAKQETKAKELGIALAAGSSKEKLQLARAVAERLGRQKKLVHADMVNEVMSRQYGIETLGNAAGALFRVGPWIQSGMYHESTKPGSHRNLLRVWRYVG